MLRKKCFIIMVLTALFFSPVKANAKASKCLPIKPGSHARITSSYGWRIHPISKTRTFHNGIDIGAPKGTYVYAFMDGKVVMARPNGSAGNEIKINHGNGLETRYLHMDKRAVREGDKVKAGQVIGTVGSTGRSTGPHLHFETRLFGKPVNPNSI